MVMVACWMGKRLESEVVASQPPAASNNRAQEMNFKRIRASAGNRAGATGNVEKAWRGKGQIPRGAQARYFSGTRSTTGQPVLSQLNGRMASALRAGAA